MKRSMGLVCAVLFIIIRVYGQAAEQKPVLAVLSLTSQNVSPGDTSIIMGFVQEEFFYSQKYQLVERIQIDKLLQEIHFQQSGLCDVECAVNLGKQLAAQKVVYGTVGKLGNAYSIQLSMIDVATSAIEGMYSILEECPLEQLPGYISQLVKGLISPESRQAKPVPAFRPQQPQVEVQSYQTVDQNEPATLKNKSPMLACALSLIPGVGQYYNGQIIKGVIQQILFIGGLVVFINEDLYGGRWESDGFHAHTQPSLSNWIGAGVFVLAEVWSLIDAPNSAARINRKHANMNAHMLNLPVGDDQSLGLDFGPVYKGFAGKLSFSF
ncbi:MAG: hypothetical protein PHI34_04690 [Acidobacteriota bacterium]|nr:hypothetical protein [Acidobacteriota bacterium]